MGNVSTVNMEETFKQNQEFIQNMNKIKVEREIQLQYQLAQRRAAEKLAGYRDLCLWLTTFSVASAAGLVAGFRRTKRPYFLVPMVPLTFVTLYCWDLGYGNKLHRIKMEAEHIMSHESELLEWPCDLPTASSIDSGRLDMEDKKKIHPPILD